MPQKRHLSWDTFETSQRCRMEDVFLEIYLKCLKDVSRKTSFLRCLWDVFEMSLSTETWLRYLRDVSCRWVTTLTFHVCFSSIYEFKSTSFFILAIYNPGDSYKLLQRQKIQARGNKFMARTKTNKNIGLKIKAKRRKGLYVMTIQLLSLSGGLSYRIFSNNRPFGIKRPSDKERFYPVSFL